MSNENFSDVPNAEKENKVREALGVEKRYIVRLIIPTIGEVQSNEIAVMALNKDDAEDKAKEVFYNTGFDADDMSAEEVNHDYEYDDDTNNWRTDVSEA